MCDRWSCPRLSRVLPFVGPTPHRVTKGTHGVSPGALEGYMPLGVPPHSPCFHHPHPFSVSPANSHYDSPPPVPCSVIVPQLRWRGAFPYPPREEARPDPRRGLGNRCGCLKKQVRLSPLLVLKTPGHRCHSINQSGLSLVLPVNHHPTLMATYRTATSVT